MSDRVHVDANVILRFLRNDDAKQSPAAARLLTRGQTGELVLIVSAVTLMEVFYVLATTYGIARPMVSTLLVALLHSGAVVCEDGGVTLDALGRITTNKISFGDAYLAATAVHAAENVASFDKGMTRFAGVELHPVA